VLLSSRGDCWKNTRSPVPGGMVVQEDVSRGHGWLMVILFTFGSVEKGRRTWVTVHVNYCHPWLSRS